MHSNLNNKINTRISQQIPGQIDDPDTVVSANATTKQKPLAKKQHKLKVHPAHVRTARIERVACPLHIIELK